MGRITIEIDEDLHEQLIDFGLFVLVQDVRDEMVSTGEWSVGADDVMRRTELGWERLAGEHGLTDRGGAPTWQALCATAGLGGAFEVGSVQ